MHQLETILSQEVCFMLSLINDKLKENPSGNVKDPKNYDAAIRLITAAQLHSSHYYLSSFREAVDSST